jgi:carbonic anhydrase
MVHHSEATNSYIVIAILVEQGEPDPAFDFLEKNLPIYVGETKEVNSNYYFGSTFPEMYGKDTLNIYSYQGSLTTPPCTESVLWIVIKDPTYASASQIEILQKLMPKNNYREVQPLNGRPIYSEIILDDISVLNQ